MYCPRVRSYSGRNLRNLTDDERKEEIARMLAGERVTDEARAAAGSLLGGNSR